MHQKPEKPKHQRVFSERFHNILTDNITDDDLDLKRVNSRSLDNYKEKNEKSQSDDDSINDSIEKVENNFHKIENQFEFYDIFNPKMIKEKRQLNKILNFTEFNFKKNNHIEEYKVDDFSFSSESECGFFDEENEILEISDDSSSNQNYFLYDEQNRNIFDNFLLFENEKNKMYDKLERLKRKLQKSPIINVNLINLYKCVNKN